MLSFHAPGVFEYGEVVVNFIHKFRLGNLYFDVFVFNMVQIISLRAAVISFFFARVDLQC